MNITTAFEPLLEQIHGERCSVVEAREETTGPQGYSGSQISYFDVESTGPDRTEYRDRLVVKMASQQERRIMHLLSAQGCAVPPVVIADPDSAERAPICMPYLEPRPPFEGGYFSPLTHSMAKGLAGIHAANRLRPPAWLPHAAADYLGRLWLRDWREQWEANLRQPEFAFEFSAYSERLYAAFDQLLRDLQVLAQEADSLTLLNVDLIPDHIRLWRDSACFIDWEQSSYGTLYLDLPNAFNVETALAYRDALAQHGHAIAVADFMERFHAVSPYMGLRYLGFSLWQWAQGGAERARGRWFLYYTLHLALHGR